MKELNGVLDEANRSLAEPLVVIRWEETGTKGIREGSG